MLVAYKKLPDVEPSNIKQGAVAKADFKTVPVTSEQSKALQDHAERTGWKGTRVFNKRLAVDVEGFNSRKADKLVRGTLKIAPVGAVEAMMAAYEELPDKEVGASAVMDIGHP